MTPLRMVPVVAACLLGGAALAPAALAGTYCVSDSACVAAGGTDENGLVQHALDDAKNHAGPDRVQIGSGTFTGSTGFFYSDPSAGNPVQIAGSGRSLTQLSTTASSKMVLRIAGGSSSVQDLGIVLPALDADVGLHLDGPSTVQRVDITAKPTTTNAAGFTMASGGTLDDVHVTLPVLDHGNTAIVQLDGAASVSNAVLDAPRGLSVAAGALSTYRRIKMVDVYLGVDLTCGSMALEDASMRLKTAYTAVLVYPNPAPGCPSAGASLALRHVTVDGDGAGAPEGIKAIATTGVVSTVSVRDSILSDLGAVVDRQTSGGSADVTLDYTDFDPANDTDANGQGGTGHVTVTHAIDVDPHFASASDDRLAAGSPLIDAGDPAGLAAGESALDLAGGARILDGTAQPGCAARQDVGAYEFDPGTLAEAALTGPAGAQATVPAAFAATACSPDPGASLTFAWDFGDGSNGSGAAVAHTYAAPGPRMVTLTVTDSGGRSAVRTAVVTVGAAPAGPAPGARKKPRCHVPRLHGRTLNAARRLLKAAHCAVGAVTHRRMAGHRGAWLVRSSLPGTGSFRPAGTRVRLTLTRARRRARHARP